jgi:hypothetical protein
MRRAEGIGLNFLHNWGDDVHFIETTTIMSVEAL